MKTYTVTWEIEVDAKNEEGAAREALRIQRDNSDATCFKVKQFGKRREVLIDLDYLDLTKSYKNGFKKSRR